MASEKVKENNFQRMGFRTAGEVIESFKNRRVHFIEPLGLALSTNRTDPITGLPGLPRGSQIELFAPPGKGKCFRINTPILMYDGTIKAVQDVVPGDQVMGPDSKPRNVLSLGRGNETMYEVKPVKGAPFYCNESHTLALVVSGKKPKSKKRRDGSTYFYPTAPEKLVNISVKEYLGLAESRKGKLKLYRAECLDFAQGKELEIDPYILGLWLGDGHKDDFSITTGDVEIEEAIKGYASLLGKPVRIENYEGLNRNCKTLFLGDDTTKLLRDLDLQFNKHIPHKYKVSSINARLRLLAGLIDSDGHVDQITNGLCISQKLKPLIDDIAFLARSLGFAAYVTEYQGGCTYKGEWRPGTYYKVFISGQKLDLIPTKLKRKELRERQQIKSALRTGFSLTKLPPEDYYGFTVDGDHLFLLGDFTVVHNSATADAYVRNLHELDPGARVAILAFEEIDQMRLENLFKQGIDRERYLIMDYSNDKLKNAETALNAALELADTRDPTTGEPLVEAIIIDSVGASGTSKEIYDKDGKSLLGVDTNPQMCHRANVYTKFGNQYSTIDPNKRPSLWYINHYKDKVGQDDASTFQLKANQIGEDLNLATPGGWGYKYHLNMRVKIDAKKWPNWKTGDPKHELYDYKQYKGLEVHFRVIRNRFFAGLKECQAVLDFTDPNEVRFDIESEIIALCTLLDIDGIQDLGNGRIRFPQLGDKSYRKQECTKFIRQNSEYKWELIKKIAPLAQQVYSFGGSEEKL